MRRFTAVLLMTLFTTTLFASSHREAPLTTEDPTVDNTDVYAFRSPDAPDTITLIANYIPLQEASSAPNYYNFSPAAVYEIHIDNNGDAREDITYQFRFRNDIRDMNTFLYNTGPVLTLDSANLNFRQYYTVTRINGSRRSGGSTSLGDAFQVAPANIGPKSTPDYTALANAAIFNFAQNGGKVFAGPRDDPFFVDIGGIGDLATLRPIQQLHKVPPISASSTGVDGLRGFNVHTIALQLPITALVSGGTAPSGPTAANAVIGVWATSSRSRLTLLNTGSRGRQSLSGLTQVSPSQSSTSPSAIPAPVRPSVRRFRSFRVCKRPFDDLYAFIPPADGVYKNIFKLFKSLFLQELFLVFEGVKFSNVGGPFIFKRIQREEAAQCHEVFPCMVDEDTVDPVLNAVILE